MNPLPFILLAISLPLLLGGCGNKVVKEPELKERGEYGDEIAYIKGSDTPYTGTQIGYWKGEKVSETNYKDGKKDGPATAWYSSGEKHEEGNYKDGEMEGLHVRWHKNGQKETEGNYKDGKADGLFVEWYENGQKLMKGNFKDSKPEGLVVHWHGNGQKMAEVNFKDGKLVEGSDKYWNSKGEPVATNEAANNYP